MMTRSVQTVMTLDCQEPKKNVLNTVDKWQKGHRRAALSAANSKLVDSVTVRSWAEALEKLRTDGFAVVEDFVELFSEDCRPTAEQRDFILQGLKHVIVAFMLVVKYLTSFLWRL